MIGQTPQSLNYQKSARRRIVAISLVFLCWAAVINARLVYYQIFKHDQMTTLAEHQQQRTIKTSPKRGSIIDRKGRELARSIEVESVYAAPNEVRTPQAMAAILARILAMPEDVVLSRLTAKKMLVSLKRKLNDEEAKQVRACNFEGLHFVTETKRFYPKDEIGAYVLGFVGMEEDGFAGVERQYDRHIQGRAGYVFVETDAHGKPFGRYEKESEVGQSLQLTIDEQIQFRTEKALKEAVANVGAKGGTAVVMRPKTGEILAMATLPGFNPNEPISDPDELRDKRRNRAVEDAYEPGSVFKVITYSAALESGLLKPSDKIDCQGGSITIAGHTVKDGGHYGSLTVAEAVEVSSNVAAIKTGRLLGKDRLLEAINRFGFGQPVGIGLPGESPGFVGGTKHWSEASFGALPIGYQVSATPVQILAAVSAVANNGQWVQPHVLKQIVSTTGDIVYQAPVQTKQVISKKTAEAMKAILEGVVQRGTAKLARLDGYSAAGKTGTAHKYDHATGRYAPNRYYATFCGFAPVNDPEVAVIVQIDEPRLGVHHGGQAAAPAFKTIAEMALRYLSIPPDNLSPEFPESDRPMVVDDNLPEEGDLQLDDVVTNEPVANQPGGENGEQSIATAPASGALPVNGAKTPIVNGVAGNVGAVNVVAANGAATARPPVAVLSLGETGNGGLVMPDLKGQGIRTALHECKELGLKLTFQGLGEVVEQYPVAGAAVAPGTECRVVLKKLH